MFQPCDSTHPRRQARLCEIAALASRAAAYGLLRVLTQVRAAQSFLWDARPTLYWRTVFPQMTNWLPDEEAAQLRFEFETELKQLDAA